MYRRQFLAGMGVLAAAGGGTPRLAAKARRKHFLKGRPGMIPILDTHQHLWDLGKFKLPWLTDGPLAQNHLISDYLVAAEGLNIVKTIYMEVDVAPEQKAAEAEYIIDLCERPDNPLAGAVIGGRPGTEGFREYVHRFKGSEWIKGVRQVLPGGGERPFWLEDAFVKDIRLLGELGFRYDLCIPMESLSQGAELVRACPHTRFILDHCGNAQVQAPDLSGWKAGMDRLAKEPNIICKISGIVASAKPEGWTAEDLAPVVNHCAEAFRRDRIVFGSDWPVCTKTATLRQWVEALQQIVHGWPEGDRRKLFYGNAAEFYESN